MKYDVVVIGGGLAGLTAGLELQKKGMRTIVVSTGLTLHEVPRKEYLMAGGSMLPGDTVLGGEFKDDRLLCVHTANLGETLLCADHFLLCTGKFFSKGLISTMDRIYEPVFGCDVDYSKDRSSWVTRVFSDEQPFMSFGVVADEKGRVSVKGKTIQNLYAAGEILAGKVDIIESALKVCRNII